MRNFLSLSAVIFFLQGCAGLMMSVNDVDPASSSVKLNSGDEVSINVKVNEIDEKLKAYKKDPEDFKKMVLASVAQEMKKNGIKVVDGAATSINVQMMRYDNGCGFCRGFFPVFGLGDSYFDGRIMLKKGGKTRTIMIEKVGQRRGVGTMGDPTKTNVAYFSTVMAGNLVDGAATNEVDEAKDMKSKHKKKKKQKQKS